MKKVIALAAAVCSLGLLGYQAMVICGKQERPAPSEKIISLDEVRRLSAELAAPPTDLRASWSAAPRGVVQRGDAVPKHGGFWAGSTRQKSAPATIMTPPPRHR